MGSVKAMWMDYQENEPMYEWICENYPGLSEEEEPEEWEEAVNAFEDFCEAQLRLEQEQLWQDDYDYYYITLTIKEADARLHGDLKELKAMVSHMHDPGFTQTFSKMVYAHAVTILEVYLEDVTKALILSSTQHLTNTIKNVQPFSDSKFRLSEISLEEDGIKKFVLGKLSDNLFHDIPKVLRVIGGVVNKPLIKEIDITNICTVTSTRHDIVHRNGTNRNGDSIEVSIDLTTAALNVVELFTDNLRQKLTELKFSE